MRAAASTRPSCAGASRRWCAATTCRRAERELERTLQHADAPRRGSVVLVGAGPGDAGLLTLNALRALQEADVILHDRLVSDEVLNLARRDADRICVGKMAGGHSVSQGRIHELLLEQARLGRRVVRLKGGDPFIFGRGGEELEFLERARHSVRGRARHHRGHCLRRLCRNPAHASRTRAVRAVRDGAQRRFDRQPRLGDARAANGRRLRCTWAWRDSARFATSWCSTAARHRRRSAIVENGSRSNQRVVLATLAELEDAGRAAAVKSPALVIVGEVAALAERLHWFGSAPVAWRALRAVA